MKRDGGSQSKMRRKEIIWIEIKEGVGAPVYVPVCACMCVCV